MKRPNSSDSLGALRSICQNSPDDENVNNQVTNTMYATDHEFHDHQTMMDGLYEEGGSVEESLGSGHVSEKKRRLSNEQVKALEKNFEVENKLEPERKVKLAQELGLQPRQVAVWFQNRRARWKTKNLERDYGVLKSNYDALKHDFEAFQRHNESLLKEIQELKSKLKEDGNGQVSVKQEPFVSEADEEGKHEVEAAHVNFPDKTIEADTELNLDDDSKELNTNDHMVLYDSKDHGSSDSDSSALLNDDNSNNYSPVLDHPKFMEIHNGSSSSMNVSFQFSYAEASTINNTLEDSKRAYQPQFVKIEEHDFFGEEESCTTTFFNDEQAPTLNWYNPDEWN